jgi:hypothetical protein
MTVDDFKLIRAVVFVWRGVGIGKIFRSEDIILQRQFAGLIQKMLAKSVPPSMTELDSCFTGKVRTRPGAYVPDRYGGAPL